MNGTTYLGTLIFVCVVLAKSITGVLLGTTPGSCEILARRRTIVSFLFSERTSGSEIHTVGVNRHVKGALVVLDSRLGRDGRDGHGEEGKR